MFCKHHDGCRHKNAQGTHFQLVLWQLLTACVCRQRQLLCRFVPLLAGACVLLVLLNALQQRLPSIGCVGELHTNGTAQTAASFSTTIAGKT
jgi:hypothetical protein